VITTTLQEQMDEEHGKREIQKDNEIEIKNKI
jgi:hypothetical protein